VVRRRDDRIIYSGLAGFAAGVALGVGGQFIYSNDDYRLGWRADDITVRPIGPGWTRTVVVRPNGVRVVTVRDANGFIVRRYRLLPCNQIVMLYNNQPSWWDEGDLYVDVAPVNVSIPMERYIVEPSTASIETIYETVTAPPVAQIDRSYTLNQVLFNEELRDYMPRIDLDTITFELGSAEVPLDQIDLLEGIGVALEEAISTNADEVYLIEGHTDATGTQELNLALSDQRAESVAEILTQYFEIPPENLVTQGFGEQFLKIPTEAPERQNRRVAIRRITPLLSTESDQIALNAEGDEIDEGFEDEYYEDDLGPGQGG
jgi:outer membrane protein OmpA-like peptidoglycan-associated protein